MELFSRNCVWIFAIEGTRFDIQKIFVEIDFRFESGFGCEKLLQDAGKHF